jgi:bifunctional ADP-heptose synthase (sugar kinase/adenylyltransferase)
MQQLLARCPHVPIIVDPARGANWEMYRGAAAVVPNEDEWITAWDAGLDSLADSVGRMFRVQKRGAGGISVYRPGGEHERIPGHQVNCVDVCGAGDQVLATLGVMLAEGQDWMSAARIANLAASLKCERRGATPVPRQELDNALLRHGFTHAAGHAVATV